ncbi:LysR family transcriptional regulator [Nesterenkonia halophila]
MEHRLLRYFVAVAEEGGVSAAAETLHMTQPALSRQIRSLESGLGLALFDRTGPRLSMTSEGRAFLSTAQQVLQAHDHARGYARQLAAGRLEHVGLAAPGTTLVDVVAPFVATFTAGDPVPSVAEIPVDADPRLLVAAHDLVLVTHEPGDQVASRRLAELPVWACVPADHRWAGRGAVALEELVEEQLVLTSRDYMARRLLDGALEVAGLAPHGAVEARHSHVAQALAAAGRGVAVVTDDPHFALVPLRIRVGDGDLRVRLTAAWRSRHHAAATLEALVERLRGFSAERYGPTVG